MRGLEAKSFILSVKLKQSVQCDGQSGITRGGMGRQGFPAQNTCGAAFPSVLRGSSSLTLPTWPARFTNLSLGHQLPLGCRGRFDEGTRGSSNGFSSFQDLFFKSRVSSACYNQKKTALYTIHTPKDTFCQMTYFLVTWLSNCTWLFMDQPHPG